MLLNKYPTVSQEKKGFPGPHSSPKPQEDNLFWNIRRQALPVSRAKFMSKGDSRPGERGWISGNLDYRYRLYTITSWPTRIDYYIVIFTNLDGHCHANSYLITQISGRYTKDDPEGTASSAGADDADAWTYRTV